MTTQLEQIKDLAGAHKLLAEQIKDLKATQRTFMQDALRPVLEDLTVKLGITQAYCDVSWESNDEGGTYESISWQVYFTLNSEEFEVSDYELASILDDIAVKHLNGGSYPGYKKASEMKNSPAFAELTGQILYWQIPAETRGFIAQAWDELRPSKEPNEPWKFED